MKVFISWSGENTASHKIACTLREWLPCVINIIKPFVSSEDIQKGRRGLTIIEEQLRDSSFGIICVTKENYRASWLLFEAGALSCNPNKVPVVPFLFGLLPSDLTGSPLIQFQYTVNYSKESIKGLVESLNKECSDRGLQENLLNRTFEKWYPELELSMSSIKNEIHIPEEKPTEKMDIDRTILEEILEITRNNQKALSNTSVLSSESFSGRFIKPYEFIVEFETNKGCTTNEMIEITQEKTLSDVLDAIFYLLNGKVLAFSYLIEWILQDKNSGRNLVASAIQGFIPAHVLFKRDSIWTVRFLNVPYVTTIDENRRWYRN